MTPHDTHMLRLASSLFKTAEALKADCVRVQSFTNSFLEHVLYYMNNGLVYGGETVTSRTMFAREMESALSPVYDPSASSNGATLLVPFDEGYYDDDYKYEYYLFYRDSDDKLQVKILDAPPKGGYPRHILLGDFISDVVVIHLTLSSKDSSCVSFSTYRVKQ